VSGDRSGVRSVAAFATVAFSIIVTVSVVGLPSGLASSASCPFWFPMNGVLYCGENATAGASVVPTFPPAPARPLVVFHGDQFRLRLAASPVHTIVMGNVTEPNGTLYEVEILGPLLTGGAESEPYDLNWTSPGGSLIVWWPAPLIVSYGGGGPQTNVVLGVAAP